MHVLVVAKNRARCQPPQPRLPLLLQVVLSTHAIKAISLLDMVMAAKIDALPVQYSPKWEREHKARLAAQQAGSS
jgi:hypothetical protein